MTASTSHTTALPLLLLFLLVLLHVLLLIIIISYYFIIVITSCTLCDTHSLIFADFSATSFASMNRSSC